MYACVYIPTCTQLQKLVNREVDQNQEGNKTVNAWAEYVPSAYPVCRYACPPHSSLIWLNSPRQWAGYPPIRVILCWSHSQTTKDKVAIMEKKPASCQLGSNVNSMWKIIIIKCRQNKVLHMCTYLRPPTRLQPWGFHLDVDGFQNQKQLDLSRRISPVKKTKILLYIFHMKLHSGDPKQHL